MTDSESVGVPIRDASIRLGQLLKLAGLVEDGGHARDVLDSGAVTVDDEVETRRGRQVRPGDVVQVEAEGRSITVTVLRR
ncbi:RNA-binding S4 domain-containing protein [Angustibacter speluncae]